MMEEDDNQHQLEVFQLELCRMQDAKRALEVEVFQLEQSHQYWRIRALERENQILSGDGTMQDAKRALEEAQQAGRAAEKRAKNVERMLRKKELMWEKERSELTKAAEERISQAEEKAKLAELRALDAQQFLEMLLAQQRRNLDGHCLEWQQTKRRLNEDRVTLFVNTREVFQADIDAPHDDDDDDDDDFPVSDEDLPMNDDDNSGGERNCNSVVLPSRRRRKSKKPRTHDVCIHCYVITKRTCCAHSGGLKLSEARQLVMNMYPNLRLHARAYTKKGCAHPLVWIAGSNLDDSTMIPLVYRSEPAFFQILREERIPFSQEPLIEFQHFWEQSDCSDQGPSTKQLSPKIIDLIEKSSGLPS